MAHAALVAERGTCNRAKVGVVIARDGRILSTGYNGAPSGMPHCHHSLNSDPCTTAVHAEANAIAFAARHGVALEGAELHTTLTPCQPCAQLIINAGIVRVISFQPYRDQSGLKLLRAAGLKLT